jgi:hypothetical protein
MVSREGSTEGPTRGSADHFGELAFSLAACSFELLVAPATPTCYRVRLEVDNELPPVLILLPRSSAQGTAHAISYLPEPSGSGATTTS